MANNVMNKMMVVGRPETIRQMFEYIKGENGEIDFEKIIPINKNMQNEPYIYANLWGSKFNANTILLDNDNDTISFVSSYDMPEPIFTVIAKKFPELFIIVVWSDESLGCNCGRAYFGNGKIIEKTIYYGENPNASIIFSNLWNKIIADLHKANHNEYICKALDKLESIIEQK